MTKSTSTRTPEQRAKWAAYMRERRAKNYEHVRELERASYERNRDKATARRQAWREANPEREKATRKAYREAHKDEINAYQQQWREANPGYHRKHIHGLSGEDYEAIVQRQGGGCGICREPLTRSINVDHDHTTNEVRGILCHNCNVGLGMFKDRLDMLTRAVEWLKGAS